MPTTWSPTFPRDTPIAAYAGNLAWSAYDTATARYRLMVDPPGSGPYVVPIAPSREPFDVSLGPDSVGRAAALYTRCGTAGKGCDIYRYSLVLRMPERRLAVSSPHEDEAWPAQDGGLLTFVRRHRTGGKGEISDCDVPFVKVLTSMAPSRRLDRGSCATTTGMAIHGDRIAQVTFGSPPGTRFESQVRVLSARGGAAKVVARQGSGEESNEFASPNLSANAIWLTRTGVNPEPTFVRIAFAGRRLKMTEVRAHTELSGSFARDAKDQSVYYVEGGGSDDAGCAESTPVPCRLVKASVSPFSPLPRALLPALTISSPADKVPGPVYGDPFVLSGRLTRTVVAFGEVRQTAPIAGVPVTLLRRSEARTGTPEAFAPTGIVATTGADGRWSQALADPPSEPWFSAVAGAPAAGVPTTYAGRGTVGLVSARIALTVSGTSFAGTIVPAQPGRIVKIQRLLSRKCQTAQSGQRFCQDTWAAAAEAPVNAAGTAFAVTLGSPTAGVYSAALAFEDLAKDPAAYTGRSPDVTIG